MAKKVEKRASKKRRTPLASLKGKKAGKKGSAFSSHGLVAPRQGVFASIPSLESFLLEEPRKPKGDAVQLEFSVPRRGVRPEDVGRLFAGLWRIEEELLPPNLGEGKKVPPGMYVTYLSLNSPLKVDVTLVSLPERAAEAIVQFLSDLVFRKQAKRLRDAQAGEVEERVRSMKIDNARKTLMLARDIHEANDQVADAAAELADAGDLIMNSPLKLKSVKRPNSPANRRRRRGRRP